MTETSSPAPPATADKSSAVTVESPSLAPSGSSPLCYVVDEEPSIRHFLSLVLHGFGIDTVELVDGAALRRALEKRAPNLVFQNIPLDSTDAVQTMVALGRRRYRGAVQLMSSRGAAVLEHVESIGRQHKLTMLPVLKKPFETEAVVKVIRELKLGIPPSTAVRLGLDEVLDNNWIEFWYQPKIDLRKKRLAGAECYARARHPQHGIVLPNAFMPGAQPTKLVELSRRALIHALKAGAGFAKLGVNLPIAVNIPFEALVKLPVEEIVETHRQPGGKWAGMIIDVPEQQVVANLVQAKEITRRLERYNVRLAIDDFGRGTASLGALGELPFAELKLDRTFVINCGTDKVNAPLCKTAIDLAHNFGRVAVAMGIEKAADAMALVSMGCDFGQGFLLGQPMPEERFVSLLRQRAATQGHKLLRS